jgi:uncharacterized membrane protein
MADEAKSTHPPPESLEDVWTYRGYKIRPGEFNTAMVHFYRGEITRSNVWRTRLDSTTNWAVVATGATMSFTFSSLTNSHIVILINMLLLCVFLVIEARRYRYYELWALRVRLMETDFFAAMLIPPFAPHKEWATRLANSLLAPEFPITLMEAVGRRLRRNYIWLFLILGLAWAVKLLLHPVQARTMESFLEHANIGFIPGSLVALLVIFFFVAIFVIAILTLNLQHSAGEVLSRHEALNLPIDFLQNLANAASQVLPDDLPFLHRREHLAIIITDKAEAVSQQLMSLLKRGVTALEGKGMYSGNPRAVLLSAVAPSEVTRLKSLVYSVDENAFIVVNPTEEVLGAGFADLQPKWRGKSNSKAG